MQSLHNIGQTPYQKALSGKPTSSRAGASLVETLRFVASVVLDVVTFFVLLVPLVVQFFAGLTRKATKKNISGWTALVTGGANGLGRDICLQLAQTGCHIAVVDLDDVNGAQTVADVRKLGVKAQFFKVSSDEKRQPASGRFVKPSTQRGVLCVCFGVCFVCAFFRLLHTFPGAHYYLTSPCRVQTSSVVLSKRQCTSDGAHNRRNQLQLVLPGLFHTMHSVCRCNALPFT